MAKQEQQESRIGRFGRVLNQADIDEEEAAKAAAAASEVDIRVLEKILLKNIFDKSKEGHEMEMLKKAFDDFDADGSGEVDFSEFSMAMETFGLVVQKPGAKGSGGVPAGVLRGLYDRYNEDASDSLDFQEFADGLFQKNEVWSTA